MESLILDQIQQCPRCKKNLIIDVETAEIVCSNCGFVFNDRLENRNSTQKSFSIEEFNKKNQTGNPILLSQFDLGLSTVIGSRDFDSAGKPLTSQMKKNMIKLRTWDKRSKSNRKSAVNFKKAFLELEKIREKLSLPDAVIENAAYIYRKAQGNRLCIGRSVAAMVAATVYYSCRNSEMPRTIRDFEIICNIRRKDIVKAYMAIVKNLDLKVPVVNSSQYVSRIASKIEIPETVKRHAILILDQAQKNQISAGKDPIGLTAAALHIISPDYLILKKKYQMQLELPKLL